MISLFLFQATSAVFVPSQLSSLMMIRAGATSAVFVPSQLSSLMMIRAGGSNDYSGPSREGFKSSSPLFLAWPTTAHTSAVFLFLPSKPPALIAKGWWLLTKDF